MRMGGPGFRGPRLQSDIISPMTIAVILMRIAEVIFFFGAIGSLLVVITFIYALRGIFKP